MQQTLFLNKNIERQYRRNTMKKILLFNLLAFCFMGAQMISFSAEAISFQSVDEKPVSLKEKFGDKEAGISLKNKFGDKEAGISLKDKFGDTQKKK